MKKGIAFALLAVIMLGIFTACTAKDNGKKDAQVFHRIDSSDKGQRRYNDQIVSGDARKKQCQMQAGSSALAGNSSIHIQILSNFFFKPVDVSAARGDPFFFKSVGHILDFIAFDVWDG